MTARDGGGVVPLSRGWEKSGARRRPDVRRRRHRHPSQQPRPRRRRRPPAAVGRRNGSPSRCRSPSGSRSHDDQPRHRRQVGWPAGPAYAGSFMLDSATAAFSTAPPTRSPTTFSSKPLSAHRQSRRPAARRGTAPTPAPSPSTSGPRKRNRPDERPPARGMAPSGPPADHALPRGGRRGGTVVDVPAWSGYVDDIVGDYRGIGA